MVRRVRFLLGLLAIVTALAAATRAAAPAADWTDDLSPIAPADWNAARAAHLLERAGFGGTPQDVAKLAAMTPQRAVVLGLDMLAPSSGAPLSGERVASRPAPHVPHDSPRSGRAMGPSRSAAASTPWRARAQHMPSACRSDRYCCQTVRLELPLLWNPSVAMSW